MTVESRNMLPVERRRKILRLLKASNEVSVQELAGRLNSSPATIRRDLTELEEQGVLHRVHGGAVIAEHSATERQFELRESEELEAKQAIASRAFAELRPRETILLDSGTTTLQLARQIRFSEFPVTIVTNSFTIAREVLQVESVNLIVIGGYLRRRGLDFVGPLAENLLQQVWLDRAFVGATSIDRNAGVTTVDVQEAQLNRVMLEHAKRSYLLADATKFDRVSVMTVAPFDQFDVIISDTRLDDTDWPGLLRQRGVMVVLADQRRAELLAGE